MRKLAILYIQYFDLQEYLYEIQDDRTTWEKHGIKDFANMVSIVNMTSIEVRNLAKRIRDIESKTK